MPTNAFNRLVISTVLVIALLSGALAFVLYAQGPRVRLARFNTDIGHATFTQGSTLTLSFDRPIQQQDYSSSIDIQPRVDFATTTTTQGVIITFRESLDHNTTYTLTLQPAVADQANKSMRTAYTHQFTTAPATYAFLERQSGLNRDTFEDKDDHIREQSLSTNETTILFSAPIIRSFTANDDYILAVVAAEDKDVFYLIDRHTQQVTQPSVQLPGRINNAAMAPRSNTVLFTTQPDSDRVSIEYFEQYSNSLYSYDLDADIYTVLTDASDTRLHATEVHISNDGQVGLIRDRDFDYYVVSPYNDYDPVILGSYVEAFGFNDSSSEIIFRDGESIVSYDIQTSGLIPRELNVPGYISHVANSTGDIFAAGSTFLASNTISEIKYSPAWETAFQTVWLENTTDNVTLREFSVSYDNELMAIHLAPDGCEYDDIGINSECTDAFTRLYNARTQELLIELPGFNLVWLP